MGLSSVVMRAYSAATDRRWWSLKISMWSVTSVRAVSREPFPRRAAARLPPLHDGELVAQDQDLGSLPRLLAPG